MKLLILDNYDSFTYNLLHLVEKVSDVTTDVYLNDKISLEQVQKYDKILLSPGPGLPSQAGIMPQLIAEYKTSKSILGICLGLQGIGEAFNCGLKNLEHVFHGLATPVHVIEDELLFKNCPSTFNAGRYHSWVIDKTKLSGEVVVTAVDNEHHVMALRHKHYDVKGVQFHPESILSEYGETIIRNWLTIPSDIHATN